MTSPLTSAMEPSLYVAVAANCCVCPLAIDTLFGVIWRAEMTAAVTLMAAVLLLIPSFFAVTVVLPGVMVVSRPAGVMVAVAVSSDDQITLFVTSTMVLSL